MYFGPLCYGYAFNCHFVNLARSGTRPLLMSNVFCLFYSYATKKVKFITVQIDMKHVS